MRRKAVLTAVAFLAAIGLNATRANAQGYSVYEHDACTMGRAGAGVASPCTGGSAIFFNPAGIVTGERNKWNVSSGVTMIPPRGSFVPDGGGTATDLVNNNIPVPNIYVTRQLGTKWAVGVGMFAPYGLTTEWPTTSPGRFLSYKATIKGIYIQPTIAYRVSPRIQVGAGFDIVRSAVDLKQRVDASSLPLSATATFAAIGIPVGTDVADVRMHGTGTAYAAHFGIIRLNDALSLGARYMTGTTIEGAGYAGFTKIPTGINLSAGQAAALGVPTGTPLDAVLAGQFTTGGKFVTQTVNATIPMPSQLVVGFNLRVMTGLQLMGDVQLTNWSVFEQLPLTLGVAGPKILYENYVNTVGFRTALEYAVTPKLNVRGGFLLHGAAAPDHTVTPLLPEAARKEVVIGAGYQLNSGIRIDAAYQIIMQSDRAGRVADWTPTNPVPNTGVYKFSANLLGVGVAFAF
jgi:long-chain fatty acid transport protein